MKNRNHGLSEKEMEHVKLLMAYGFTDEQVAEECEITVEEAAAFRAEHSAKIARKAGESHA